MAEANPDNNKSALMRLGTNRVELASVELLRSHHKNVKNNLKELTAVQLLGVFAPNSIPPSTRPFRCLTKVSLRDLSIDEHSEGNYVLVRILEPGIQVVGWLWVIEDDQGNGCMLNVQNYPPLELPCVRTVLIVKEPFMTESTPGIPLIRCDCPTDLIVLRRSHQFYHLAEGVAWRNKPAQTDGHEDFVINPALNFSAHLWFEYGSSFVSSGYWSLAEECYLLALKVIPRCSDDECKKIQSQLCLVYLCLGYYEKTIATAESILDDILASLCAGRAHYYLRKYQDARNVFQNALLRHGSDAECEWGLRHSTERLLEQDSGFGSIDRLKDFIYTHPFGRPEYGDFVGPVRVVDIPGKGRGLRLTRDVPPETILIVSKAFACTVKSGQNDDSPLNKWLSINFPINWFELEAEIAQTIMKNPKTFGEMVYDLSIGEVPHSEVQLFCDSVAKDEPICNMPTIKAIRKYNLFNILPEFNSGKLVFGHGLFIMPSYLNHSCEPNVFITFYNDVMVVRSIGHLESEVELCNSYVDGVNAIARQMTIKSGNGFVCLCTFCVRSS